ncbi:MAG TPA: type II toxin-antitoxin system RelE/ParE family toxin [Candidatus Acidoferrum sp.]|nr:type II toxin-antitoxin system RelE/ParE family toxin [Candidatus Acidoferrum sp.]
MRVRWTTPAREQLVAAHQYIAEDHPRAAARMAEKIWKSTQLLGKHPMAGRPERVEGTRELVVRGTPFVVAYRVRRNEVQILAVMHGARKWPEEF